MGRGTGSISPTMALLTAICLLWVYPFCLFHQASVVAYQRVTSSDSNPNSSPPVLCDDHQLCVALSGHKVTAAAKAGLDLRHKTLQVILHERFLTVGRHAPMCGGLHGVCSVSLSPPKALHVLYAVYQI